MRRGSAFGLKDEEMKSLWLCILVLLNLSTSVLGAEPDGERLHVGYSIYAGVTAPLWATKEAGLFEKNGLNVQLVYLRGGTEAAQALITGDIPFAMMGGGAVTPPISPAREASSSPASKMRSSTSSLLRERSTPVRNYAEKDLASHPWGAPPIWPRCVPYSILA